MDLLEGMMTFVRVVDAGTLSKAARALRLSTAAVSRQLTALEEDVGARLLLRSTRGLRVTEEGRCFYEGAQRTLREADDARASVRSSRAVSGLLTVSVPTPLALAGLDRSLPGLLAQHSGLSIDLRLEDHAVDLVGDGVDVAIRAGLDLPDTTAVVAHTLALSSRAVVASPSYLRAWGEPKAPEHLIKHDVVVHVPAGGGSRSVWRLRRGDELAAVDVRGRLRTSSLLAVRSAALGGAGLALLPTWLVAREVEDGTLRTLSLDGFEPEPHRIYAIHRTELSSVPRVRAFVDHARAHILPQPA
jgi:DNA-binding transcriptional LysR family regulator